MALHFQSLFWYSKNFLARFFSHPYATGTSWPLNTKLKPHKGWRAASSWPRFVQQRQKMSVAPDISAFNIGRFHFILRK
jgi:hypothetical protein